MSVSIEISDESNSNSFVQIFKNLNKFSDFITLEFKHDSLYVQGMDSTKSAIFDLNLTNDWFCKFNVTETVSIGLSSMSLSKIFGLYKEKQNLILDYQVGNDNITISFNSNSSFLREFVIPLNDIKNDQLSLPEIDYDVEFSIDTKMLTNIVDQIKIFDEKLDIICDEEQIIFKATGIDGSIKCVLYDDKESIDFVTEYVCTEGTTFDFAYSVKIFIIFCSFEKVSKEVKLGLTNDMPMHMIYKLNETSNLSFYLAPKMKDYDNDL